MDKKIYSNLTVSSAPHIVSNTDTTRIMLMVLIALAPSFAMSIYVFGPRVIALTLVCLVSCMFFEWAYNKLMKKPQTVGDLSAAVTGVLIAFNVPSGLPYWIAIVGCFVAIIIVKQLYGGIGKNLVNPAITARIVLFLSFTTDMTYWADPTQGKVFSAADAVTSATPLGIMNESGIADAQSPEEFDAYIDKCKELSLYDTGVSAEYGDKLITLSTCEYFRTNGRIVVVAKKVTESSGANAPANDGAAEIPS